MTKELQLSTGPYKAKQNGLEITREPTYEEYLEGLRVLATLDDFSQWAIGDMLISVKSHYGDKVYEDASKILGLERNTLEQYKSLAERIKLCSRLQNRSFEHHRQVASLKKLKEVNGKLQLSDEPDMEKMQEFLAMDLSVRELRERVNEYKRRQEEEIRLANQPEKFSVILADPAWEYDFSLSDSRKIENQYTPTSLPELKRLKIPAADNCVLFMWATSPKIREALELIEAWRFEYKTCMVWVKDKIGMGYYARQKHELLLIASRGKLELPNESERPPSVFFADRTDHSKKPKIVYEIIEKMYPDYRKLEMFSRNKMSGWESWGDETQGFDGENS